MPYLAAQAAHGRVCDGGVLFLTPCHATPYYSHVHRNVSMRFLDCSPPPTAGTPVRVLLARRPSR
jgi:phosphatidylinositol glycan class B